MKKYRKVLFWQNCRKAATQSQMGLRFVFSENYDSQLHRSMIDYS